MKLLIVQAGFGAGGAEKNVAMIAAHRAASGDDVHVAAITCPAGGSYFDFPADVTLHVLEPNPAARRRGAAGGGLTVPVRRTRLIRRLIRNERPDVVLTFLTKINVLALVAAMGTGTRVIVSERNNPRLQFAHPAWQIAQSTLARRADACVALTERGLAELPAVLRSRGTVIPSPCRSLPIKGAGQAGRAERAVRLVAVGRLVRQKGFDLLLGAFERVVQQEPSSRLTIFGEGPERERLERLAQRLGISGAVSMPGISEEPGAWASVGDILVISSLHEGLGNVIAEATVSGLPVVSFDCAFGPRELIIDGVNGLLVPEQDVGALAEATVRLIRDAGLRARMSEARRINARRLSPETVLPMWDRVIESVYRQEAA